MQPLALRVLLFALALATPTTALAASDRGRLADDGAPAPRVARVLVRDVFPAADVQEGWLFGFEVEADRGVVTLGVRSVRANLAPTRHGSALYPNIGLYAYHAPYADAGGRRAPAGDPARSTATGSVPPISPEQRDRRTEDRVVIDLLRSGSLAAADIDVSVEAGVATLAGAVPDAWARMRAVRIADHAAGVRRVIERLRIDPALEWEARAVDTSDDRLAEQVAHAIAASVYPGADASESVLSGWEVEAPHGDWEVEVDVDDATAVLDGEVPSLHAVRLAAEAARRVPGVRSVVTRLEILGDPGYVFYPYPPGPPGTGGFDEGDVSASRPAR